MSRPKQKWTSEEEAALKAGVGKYGEGSWQRIRNDPEFGPVLVNRTNVDLKDKWRNMKPNNYVSSSRRKGRTSCIPVIDDPLITCPEPCRSSLDKRRAPTYKAMIYQSLSSIDDPNGTDVNTMANFLESKYFLPYKFKRSLAATVRRLVHTGKLEKVNNRYKLKGLSSDAETSQEEDVGNVDNENEAPRESLQDAARVAAFQVAVAETKEYRVIKACEDKQKFAELLEASTAMLSFAVDLHEQCEKHGPMTLPPKVPFA